MLEPGQITLLLRQADDGDRDAAAHLFDLVQGDLQAIARKRKRHGPAVGDASTTYLVDEAFLRLVGKDASTWNPGDRRKFFGYASKKIQELLLKAARAERAARRGGGRRRVDQDEAAMAADAAGDQELLFDLQEALDRFERFAPEEALGFRLRYFLGCTFEEIAEIIGVSATEAKRGHERAKLWLRRELKEYDLDG